MGNEVIKTHRIEKLINDIEEKEIDNYSLESLKKIFESILELFDGPQGDKIFDELIRKDEIKKEKINKCENDKNDQSNKTKNKLLIDQALILNENKSNSSSQIDKILINKNDNKSSNRLANITDNNSQLMMKSNNQENVIYEENKLEKLLLPKLYYIVSKSVTMTFHTQYNSIYITLVNIMKKFKNNKEFLKILYEHSLNDMVNMILSNERILDVSVLIIIIRYFTELLTYFSDKPEELKQYLTRLGLIMKVPRRLNDKNFIKNKELKIALMECLKLSLNILNFLNENFSIFPQEKLEELNQKNYEIEFYKKKQLANEDYRRHGNRFNRNEEIKNKNLFIESIEINQKQFDELISEKDFFTNSKELIRNLISEYHNSTIFVKLLEDCLNEDFSYEIKVDIMKCFVYLVGIESVLNSNIIRHDREVLQIINFLPNNLNENFILQIFYFLLNFYINSYKLNLIANFLIYLKENNFYVEDLFFPIFESSSNEEIKLIISLIILILSLIPEIWIKFKSIGIIKPTSRYIQFFIYQNCQNLKKFDNNYLQLNLIFKIFDFITEDNNFGKINHIDLFKYHINSVLILFKINHPNWNNKLPKILLNFSRYYDCKIKIMNENILNILLSKIYRIGNDFLNLKKIYLESTENLDKLNIIISNLTMDDDKFKIKYSEDLKFYEKMIETSKSNLKIIIKNIEEFSNYLAIINSLLCVNDYETKFEEIFNKVEFLNLYKILEKCDETFKDHNFMKIFIIINGDEIESLKGNKSYEKFIIRSTKYFYQFTLLRIIHNPEIKIQGYYFDEHNIENDINNIILTEITGELNYYLDWIGFYINNHDILYKLIFSLNRFIVKLKQKKLLNSNSEDSKNMRKTIHSLIKQIVEIIYSPASSVVVNREGLRFLNNLTMSSDGCYLWLRFDSNKPYIDYSNNFDLVIKYNKKYLEFSDGFDKRKFRNELNSYKKTNLEKGILIHLPYKKVHAYNHKMGIIFYSNQVFILPKSLYLGTEFTICFRFFNPIISTEKFHTLLQTREGGSIISIHPNRRRLGCFSLDGEWIESGIDLEDDSIQNEWVQVIVTYTEDQDLPKISFYLEGEFVSPFFIGHKYKLPHYAKYIGNSIAMNEPFGVLCDLRIYNYFCSDKLVKDLFTSDLTTTIDNPKYLITYYFDNKIISTLISNFLISNDKSDETFYFTIKLFNNLLSEAKNRKNKLNIFNSGEVVYNNSSYITAKKTIEEMNFYKSKLINKICSHFNTNLVETKKEIAKFLKTLE